MFFYLFRNKKGEGELIQKIKVNPYNQYVTEILWKPECASNYIPANISTYQFLPVVSKCDATELSDRPRLRNEPILYSRRSRAVVSRCRDLILRAAHCHSSRAISSSVPERTTSNSRLPDIETAVVSDLMSRKRIGDGVRLKRRGKRESSWIVGVYRFLFNVAVETFKGPLLPLPLLSETEGLWGTGGGDGGGEKKRNVLVAGEVALRSRQWSFVVTLRPNGHDVCLFRPGCHNTPTTDRSGVLTSVMYLPRNPR